MDTRQISRSSHEAYCKCPRRHYYGYAYRGTGLSEAVTPLHLAIGLAHHMGMETLLKTSDLAAAIAAGRTEWDKEGAGQPAEMRDEGAALIEAMLRGWYRLHYQTFLEEYEVLSIEQEGRIQLSSQIELAFRADAVCRDRLDGRVYVFNWKTAGSTYKWDEKWETDIQTWTEALAVERTLGEPVEGCIMEGFHKGTLKYDHFSTPLLWAYQLTLPSGDEVYSSEYQKPGRELYFDEEKQTWRGPWKKVATWRTTFPFGEGLAAWIGWLPESTLAASYVRSRPILRPKGVVEAWLPQVIRREEDALHVMTEGSEEDKLKFFWQNWSDMNCRWCAFKPICLGEITLDKALEEGYLKERVDHHAQGETS